jgi:hypothetical protein
MEVRSEAQMDLTLDLDDKSKFKAVVIIAVQNNR